MYINGFNYQIMILKYNHYLLSNIYYQIVLIYYCLENNNYEIKDNENIKSIFSCLNENNSVIRSLVSHILSDYIKNGSIN